MKMMRRKIMLLEWDLLLYFREFQFHREHVRQVHHVQLIELQPHVQVQDLNPVRYRFQSVLLIQHEGFSQVL